MNSANFVVDVGCWISILVKQIDTQISSWMMILVETSALLTGQAPDGVVKKQRGIAKTEREKNEEPPKKTTTKCKNNRTEKKEKEQTNEGTYLMANLFKRGADFFSGNQV